MYLYYLTKYFKYKNKYLKLIGGYNNKFKIILTVPHCQPNINIPIGNRTHDMKAISFALKLLILFENYEVEIIKSIQSRNICDDNRKNALYRNLTPPNILEYSSRISFAVS